MRFIFVCLPPTTLKYMMIEMFQRINTARTSQVEAQISHQYEEKEKSSRNGDVAIQTESIGAREKFRSSKRKFTRKLR